MRYGNWSMARNGARSENSHWLHWFNGTMVALINGPSTWLWMYGRSCIGVSLRSSRMFSGLSRGRRSVKRCPSRRSDSTGPGFFSTSRVFFSTSCLFFNLRCLFFNLRGSVFISTSFFLFFQPHMSFFGPHISSHVFFSTSHIFFSTSHVFLSTLYVSLSTCNVSLPSPLDWFLFGMLRVLWVNVGFLWSAFPSRADFPLTGLFPFAG